MSYATFKITNVYSDDVYLQKLKLQAVFMAQFRQQLNNIISSGGSHKEVQEKYWFILDSILTHNEDELIEALKTFIEAIANENVNRVISRQLLSEVGATLVQLEDSVSHFTLEVVQPHIISFEDQLVAIRQREQNWSEAGKVLVGIPLETSQKQYTVDFKLETYLKIARYFMEPERKLL